MNRPADPAATDRSLPAWKRAWRWLDLTVGHALTRRMRLGYWVIRGIAQGLLRAAFGLRVHGMENVPREGKLLLVSNHLSNFDPPVVGSTVPREIHFAAKIELFKGVVGTVIAYLNSVPIRRGSGSDKDSLKRMVRALNDGGALLIFPEGTRARAGEPPRDAKAGVGMIAAMAKADVLPIRLTGTHDPKQSFRKRGTMSIRFGTPIAYEDMVAQARATLPEDAGKKELYKAFADVAMTKVRELQG